MAPKHQATRRVAAAGSAVMGTAMQMPTRLGEPCWTADAPDRAISSIARLSRALEPYFVATHAPFGAMVDDKGGATIDEHALYRRLFHGGRTNVFAVIHGDPGTGKSHLIRWLHLQCEAERQRGDLSEVVPVLIQRRTGSLKDALQQLVDQLPEAYERHVRPVREAVGHLGHDLARHALVAQLQLQLLSVEGASPELKHLNEFCGSPGTKAWLIRDGGAVDRIIRQLTEESDVQDRETLPPFTVADLALPELERNNIASGMLDLLDEFDFERERGEAALIEEAAVLLNSAARPAVKGMSGFIGAGLRDVIDEVRRELRKEEKRLVLFVEDVSVMAALDDDLLNAVEPNPDPALAPLVAIVGMTQTGYDNLLKRENLVGRTTDLIALGTEVVEEWRERPAALATFVARYLNVVRFDDAGVERVAASRRDGGDVARSACDHCPVRDACHETFGAVRLDQVNVGVFPFTQESLTGLFFNLREDPKKAIRRNPRGLLEHIVKPVLRHERSSLADGEFPHLKLAVDLEDPIYWTSFEARYLGGWPAPARARMRRFAQGWVSARTPEEAAAASAPFLVPLRFPEFSAPAQTERRGRTTDVAQSGDAAATAGARGHPESQGPDSSTRATTGVGEGSRQQERRAEPEELRAVLKAMREWVGGAPLREDDEPRELLFALIKQGLDWDNQSLPLEAHRDRAKNKNFVRFEDQLRRPATQRVFFDVSRSEEARAVVEALARWRWQGERSWDFPDGQLHFRVAGRWLRRHRDAIVRSLQPPESLGTEEPLKHAVRLLSAVASLRRGVALPTDRSTIVRDLLAPVDAAQIAAADERDQAWVSRIVEAHPRVSQFAVSELAARQGGGGASYINPLPLLRHARSLQSEPNTPPLSREFFAAGNYWQPRYGALAATDDVADLAAGVTPRREALKGVMTLVSAALIDAQIPLTDVRAGVVTYLEQFGALLVSQEQHFQMRDERIVALRPHLGRRNAEWAAALGELAAAVGDGDPTRLLLAPVRIGAQAGRAISDSHAFVQALIKAVADHERTLNEQGDPLEMLRAIRQALAIIAEAEVGEPLTVVGGET